MRKSVHMALGMGLGLSLLLGSTCLATEIKVWVADNVIGFTEEHIETFKQEHPEYADVTFTLQAVGEGETATNMITDVQAGADVYVFAQEQIARLISAGAIEAVAPDNVEAVTTQNDAGSVAACTIGDVLYAYPVTSDNGYFLYYDKSVVSDPSTLEGILADCEAAGKNFYYQMNSGWYQTAFFFATGAKVTYDTDENGVFTACNINYASEPGLVALKELIDLKASPCYQNGSSIGEATKVGAIIDGTWDSGAVKQLFGENYACAKLPTFEGCDGQVYQMSGFGGYKLLGVKPQEDEEKLMVCDALAAYLSSGEVQLDRYEAVGWGPSNLEAQASDVVQADEALTALAEQLNYTLPQGPYPTSYWEQTVSLGDSILSDELTQSSTDEELMAVLENFQTYCQTNLD